MAISCLARLSIALGPLTQCISPAGAHFISTIFCSMRLFFHFLEYEIVAAVPCTLTAATSQATVATPTGSVTTLHQERRPGL